MARLSISLFAVCVRRLYHVNLLIRMKQFGIKSLKKGRDPRLRRKCLEKASGATLTVLQETARIHEAVGSQMQSMVSCEPDQRVNAMKHQGKGKNGKKYANKKRGEKKCYMCDGTGHTGRYKSCPALGKTCSKSGFLWNFAVCFKSKVPKKRSSKKQRADGAYQVTDKPEEDYHAFVLKGGNDSSGVVDLCVGGVQVKNDLIDSGGTFNIVNRAIWEILKRKGVQYQS